MTTAYRALAVICWVVAWFSFSFMLGAIWAGLRGRNAVCAVIAVALAVGAAGLAIIGAVLW